MHRYIGVIWNKHSASEVKAAEAVRARLRRREPPWRIVHDSDELLVAHQDAHGTHPHEHTLGAAGVVLGKLFHNVTDDQTAAALTSFSAPDVAKIQASGGRHLANKYWGSYVALIRSESGEYVSILRDPTGAMPCYHTRQDGLHVVFHSIEDLIGLLPLSLTFNRQFLTRWMIGSASCYGDTGFQEVIEPISGECFVIPIVGESVARHRMWCPIEICQHDPIDDLREATSALRTTVQGTINSWASCYQSITVLASGGLDSSIVACCLAQAPSKRAISYLNYASTISFDEEPLQLPGADQKEIDRIRSLVGTGDERHYARLLSDRWGTPLIEETGIDATDLSPIWDMAPTSAPVVYLGGKYIEDTQMSIIKQRSTQAFFTGNAGDAVLLSTTKPFAAIDYVFLHQFRQTSHLMQHLFSAAALSKQTFWAVLRKTFLHGLMHRPMHSQHSYLAGETLISKTATQHLAEADFESSIAALPGYSHLPPGKQNHVRGLGGEATHHSLPNSSKYADFVDPLNSQPIWETLLRIPTYVLLANGTSRGLARQAFSDILPKEIQQRTVKGTGTPRIQQTMRRGMSFWHPLLSEGQLLEGGYLDRSALAALVTSQEPFLRIDVGHIARCLAAEVWMRKWRGILARTGDLIDEPCVVTDNGTMQPLHRRSQQG